MTPTAERTADGQIRFTHTCEGGSTDVRILPTGPNDWQWSGEKSITPSIHCLGCGTHGWWQEGRWVSA